MPPIRGSAPPSLARYATTAAVALMILGLNGSTPTKLVLRAAELNNTPILELQKPTKGGKGAGSGTTVGVFTTSGATLSGATLTIADQKTGSGRLKIGGSDGGGICSADQDGTGCTCTDWNNGAAVLRIGTAAECP